MIIEDVLLKWDRFLIGATSSPLALGLTILSLVYLAAVILVLWRTWRRW